ncbi:MAG: radical SAM protein [Candidatus Binatia bacterium]
MTAAPSLRSLRALLRRGTAFPRRLVGGARFFLKLPRYEGVHMTPRRVLNCYLSRIEHGRLRTRLASYPIRLVVEPTNVCNLRCPACFTGDGQVGRARTPLAFDAYERLLAEVGPYLLQIEFCNWGEPLLAKQIVPMIAAAHRYGISTDASTNLSVPLDAAGAEALVASGLDLLGVSLDGARQETYEQYRIGGKIDLVLENCRLLRDAKRRLGSRTPRMVWCFHAFPHNLGDVERAQAMARDLDMDFAASKGWVVGAEWDPSGPWQIPSSPLPFPCLFLWAEAVVNNDGGVSPCCGTFYREDDMGQLAVTLGAPGARTFREVWNGPRFQAARRLYRDRSAATPEDRQRICYECPTTIAWERWQAHRAAGGDATTFDPGFTTNEGFNFFWNRRPADVGPDRRPRRAPTVAAPRG